MPVAVPLLAAGVGAAGSVLASNSASKAQQQSANATQQAADNATAEQRRQFDISQANNAPYLQAGQGALSQLSQLYNLNGTGSTGTNWNAYLAANPDVQQAVAGGAYGGEGGLAGAAQRHYQEYGQAEGRQTQAATNLDPFMASPDYQFRQNEQNRALTARNAALGIQDSGAAQKSALQYSGNLASGEFNNFANRLSALAGVGQTAANQGAQAGQAFANNVGNIAQNQAQNLSSSYQQQGAIRGNTYGSLAGMASGLISNFSTPQYGAQQAATGPGLTNFAGLYR